MKEGHILFESFPKPKTSDWVKAASGEISGADPFEKLRWTSPDQQEFGPYYAAEDLSKLTYLREFRIKESPVNAQDPRSWANMPEVVVLDEEVANNTALHHLQLEADGILFSTQGKQLNFQKLLKTIEWEHCAVSFTADPSFPVTDLINYISDRSYKYENLQGNLFWRNEVTSPPALPSHNGFRFAGIKIAPSTPVEEISEALTRAVSTIEDFASAGHKISETIRHIAFCVPLSAQLLLNVSKLRALRILWYQVAQSYGVKDYSPDDLYIHGYSDKWINEQFQPHGNMLKGTVAAIAAISGGADGLTIIPEDDQHAVMSRIARNTSVILKAESQLAKVNDPFAGAYGVEVITDRIVRDAWAKFQANQ